MDFGFWVVLVMTLTWAGLFFVVGLSGLVGVFLGWCVCWAVAIRFGETTAWYRFRREAAHRPVVSMQVLPPGMRIAQVLPERVSVVSAEEIIGQRSTIVQGG